MSFEMDKELNVPLRATVACRGDGAATNVLPTIVAPLKAVSVTDTIGRPKSCVPLKARSMAEIFSAGSVTVTS
jgi:hypothetical protein